MGDTVSVFGLRGSGKTCYIYAMAQVLKTGVASADMTLSLIENSLANQSNLNNGYLEMVRGHWPDGSNWTTLYDFNVRLLCGGQFKEVLPHLKVNDYKGGILEGTNEDELKELMTSFANSCALIFLVDGETLFKALEPLEQAPDHRLPSDVGRLVESRNRISWIENLFMEYRKGNNNIPPVIVAVTKSDIFKSPEELEHGKSLIRRLLPSLFGRGTNVDSAITAISIGRSLSHGPNNQLNGELVINTTTNIHIPMLYTLYAYIDSVYSKSDGETKVLYGSVLKALQRMFTGRIDMYANGVPVFPCL